MNEHQCLLCMGSNADSSAHHLSDARMSLQASFPDIRFGRLMETQAIGSGFHSPFRNQLARFSTALSADSLHRLFKELERRSGRLPEDKPAGIVKLDIDLLVYDGEVLKPEDMEREYVRLGLKELQGVPAPVI